MKFQQRYLAIFLYVAINLILSGKLVLAQSTSRIDLIVSNVCEYHGQLVINNPNDSLLVSPSMGNGGCVNAASYTHIDSIHASTIRYLELSDDGAPFEVNKIFYTGNQDTIFSFYNSFPVLCNQVVIPRDTFVMDSIRTIKYSFGRLAVIRETGQSFNLIILDTLEYDTLLIQQLVMTPLLLSLDYQYATIIGINASNNVVLNVIEISNGLLVELAVFSSAAANPLAMQRFGQNIYLASAPGDTAVYMTTYHIPTNSFGSTSVFSGAGTTAYDWESINFHFQPSVDPSGSNLDSSVITYDVLQAQQTYVSNINKKLHKIIYPGGGPYLFSPVIHVVESGIINNDVFVCTLPYFNVVDSFLTPSQTDFIESDFRCSVGINEYDDEKVELFLFPNPAGDVITIKASGLICGREYQMEIMDLKGRKMFEKKIQAKTMVNIPIDAYSPGTYVLSIRTRKGTVSEKFVKN